MGGIVGKINGDAKVRVIRSKPGKTVQIVNGENKLVRTKLHVFDAHIYPLFLGIRCNLFDRIHQVCPNFVRVIRVFGKPSRMKGDGTEVIFCNKVDGALYIRNRGGTQCAVGGRDVVDSKGRMNIDVQSPGNRIGEQFFLVSFTLGQMCCRKIHIGNTMQQKCVCPVFVVALIHIKISA